MNERAEKLLDIVRDINSWDDSLDNLSFYYNDEDNLDMFFRDRIEEFARSVTFGNYHIMDEYFRFNGYGNIETLNEFEVEKELLEWEEDILAQAKDIANNNGSMAYLLEDIEEFEKNYKVN